MCIRKAQSVVRRERVISETGETGETSETGKRQKTEDGGQRAEFRITDCGLRISKKAEGRIADCGLRISKKAENRDSTMGAAFSRDLDWDFYAFNALTNRLIF